MPPDASSTIGSNRSSISPIISPEPQASADDGLLYSVEILGWLVVRRAVSSVSPAVGAFALLLGGVAAIVGYQACAVYDPSLLVPGDAGVDAPPGASCVHAYYPDRPAMDDPSTLQ